MKKVIQKIFDFLFVPRKGALLLRNLNLNDFLEKAPISEDCPWSNTLFDYHDDFIRSIIWELKYYAHPKAIRFFAEALFEFLMEEASENQLFNGDEKIVLIPIPASKARKKKYKFNPPALLIKKVLELDQNHTFEYKNLLKRMRDAPRQSDIKNRKERLSNAKGIFEAEIPENFKSRTFYIIDDVTTTGATLLDAKRALKHAGVRRVELFALAH